MPSGYMTLGFIIITAIGAGVSITFLIYYLFFSKNEVEDFTLSSKNNLDKKLELGVNLLARDILDVLPKSVIEKQRRNTQLDKLFVKSGNPWNLNRIEFLLLQITLGVGVFIAMVFFSVLFSQGLVVSFGIVSVGTAIGYFYPVMFYMDEAKRREKAFLTSFPEALDLISMGMTGESSSLRVAVEQALPYMKKTPLRTEFERLVQAINSGKSETIALQEMAERAPTEATRGFIRSVNEANRLSAPMVSLLRTASKEARAELKLLIEQKLQKVKLKMGLAIGIPALVALFLIPGLPTLSIIGQM